MSVFHKSGPITSIEESGEAKNLSVLENLCNGDPTLQSGLFLGKDYTNPVRGDVRILPGGEREVFGDFWPSAPKPVVPVNLVHAEHIIDGYATGTEGLWELADAAVVKVPVEAGKTYSVLTYYMGAQRYNILNSEGALLEQKSLRDATEGTKGMDAQSIVGLGAQGSGHIKSAIITIPSGGTHIAVMSKLSGSDKFDTIKIIEGDQRQSNMYNNFNDDAVQIDEDVWWFGDSLIDGDYFKSEMFKQLQFRSFFNFALGGARWTHSSGTVKTTETLSPTDTVNNVIWNQVQSAIAIADITPPTVAVFMAGTNDYDGANNNVNINRDVLGQALCSDYSGNIGGATQVSAGFNVSLQAFRAKYPDCRIIIANQPQRGHNDIQRGIDLARHIEECAKIYGLDFINTHDECGILAWEEQAGDKYLFDNVHMNEAGKVLMGNFYAGKFKELLLKK